MADRDRVLAPPGARYVLPCIGSLSQTTGMPPAATASTRGGRALSSCSAPIRTMNVSRPGTASGLSLRTSSTAWAGEVRGPIFTPTGLCTDAASPTCAPSGALVLAPIQPKCVDAA